MNSDPKKEEFSELKLPLFSISRSNLKTESPERTGGTTPPSAFVPFRWEDEPGKPKPCTALTNFTIPDDFAQKCLELPPRLQLSSPTTVLEGPFAGRSSRFPSFRLAKHSSPAVEIFENQFVGRSTRFQSLRIGGDCYGSFRTAGDSSPEAAAAPYGAIVVRKVQKEKGIFGLWRRRSLNGKRDGVGGSYVFPSFTDRENDSGHDAEDISRSTTVKINAVKRMSSSPNLSNVKANFLANICGGLKKAITWSSKRVKKEGLLI